MDYELIKKIFYSPPVIRTERLIMRPIRSSDAADMFEYSSDPYVTRYLTWEPHKDLRFTKNHIKRIERSYREGLFYDWALELKDKHKMIGTCGFTSFVYNEDSCEIGYVLNPRYHGYLLATEAAKAAVRYAFEMLSARSVFARCMPQNIASRRVMQRCGMKYECDIDRCAVKQNRYVGVSQYRLTREEYDLLKLNGDFGI